jgi:hypothetical protein
MATRKRQIYAAVRDIVTPDNDGKRTESSSVPLRKSTKLSTVTAITYLDSSDVWPTTGLLHVQHAQSKVIPRARMLKHIGLRLWQTRKDRLCRMFETRY